MFHLKHPRFHGFFAWDELGCLSRAVGFPVDLFQSSLTDEIHVEENGLPYKELVRMLDYKLLYKAVHMTSNLHTADWNTCVVRRAAQILNHKALSYEDIYNARVAYQAYEDGDMKGMQLNQRVLMRTLKMCGKTISPMKLMHRIKHSQDSFDEPGRIQLYELIDLILWAHGYEIYVPAERFGHFEMEEDLFKLVDFDQLLSHHDEKLANRLDAQYLKDEWEFSKERLGNKSKFRDPTVICGDSRVEMARNQKKKYRSIKSAVGDSQKTLYCCKYGFVRERPKTAPEFSSKITEDQQSRKASSVAHNAILQKMQRVLNYSECKRPKEKTFHVDLSDRPVLKEHRRSETPKVVTQQEIVNTAERWDRLMFDIETEGSRYEINKWVEMDHFIPGYLDRKEEEEAQRSSTKHTKDTSVSRTPSSKATSAKRRVQQEDKSSSLAYPVARIPPAHGKKCDARESQFRLEYLMIKKQLRKYSEAGTTYAQGKDSTMCSFLHISRHHPRDSCSASLPKILTLR